MSTRRLSVPLPPAWFVFNVAVILLAAGLVLGDRQYWHWYSREPSAVTVARVEAVEQIAQSADDRANTALSTAREAQAVPAALAGKVDRIADLAMVSWVTTLIRNQSLSTSASSSLLTRCQDYVNKGGDFATGCQ